MYIYCSTLCATLNRCSSEIFINHHWPFHLRRACAGFNSSSVGETYIPDPAFTGFSNMSNAASFATSTRSAFDSL